MNRNYFPIRKEICGSDKNSFGLKHPTIAIFPQTYLYGILIRRKFGPKQGRRIAALTSSGTEINLIYSVHRRISQLIIIIFYYNVIWCFINTKDVAELLGEHKHNIQIRLNAVANNKCVCLCVYCLLFGIIHSVFISRNSE